MISRKTMKKMRMILDLEEDTVIVGKEKINLRVTESGIYQLPLEGNAIDQLDTDDRGSRDKVDIS